MLERQRHGRRQAEPTRELGRRQPARQLQQRERIPARLGDDPLEDPLVEPSRQAGLQQRPRIAMAQGPDVQLRQPAERGARLARREHDRDPLRQQAPGNERERACRRTIEPVRVVDEAQERPLLGGLRQQAEHREPHEERIRRLAGAQPERDGERFALGCGQGLHQVGDRRAELLERRVRQLHLPLDADDPQNPEVPRGLDRILEQSGLPH